MRLGPIAACAALLSLGMTGTASAEVYFELNTLQAETAVHDLRGPGDPFVAGYTVDATGDAIGHAFTLGYRLGGRLGVEVGFRDYGELAGEARSGCLFTRGTVCLTAIGIEPVQGSASARSIALVGAWPLGDELGIAVRYGSVDWHQEVRFMLADETFREEGVSAMYGVALEWRLDPAFTATLGFSDEELAPSSATVGLRINF